MHPTTNIAVRAARDAGRVLTRYLNRIDSLKVETKQRNEFVSEVDRAAEQVIIDNIRRAYPDHAILGEETGHHDGNEFEWLIDPLDGTTNYLHGFPQFSVSIALRQRGELLSGVVYDPLREELFHASKGDGAFMNDQRIRVSKQKGLKGALLGTGIPYRDQTHVDAYFGMMRDLIEDTSGIRRPGSAALDFAYVAMGRLDGFWELGLAPWDFAAGALLIKEAGGVVTDLRGGDKYLDTGNVAAGNIGVHGAILDKIKPHLNDRLTA